MAILHITLLLMLTFHQFVAEPDNISINTSGDVPSNTAEESHKRSQENEMEDLLPFMFARGTSYSVKAKWGKGAYSKKEQKKIIAAHNDYRRNVSPSSSDMTEILWSPKLAEQAQVWSDGCVYEHPDKSQHPDYEGIGQNLYIKYLDVGGDEPPSPVSDPVTKWYDEVKDFHYNINACNRNAVCGHYTQVVWAKSTKVGCGIKFCPRATSRTTTYENAWLVTCNYSPGGNFVGQNPYKAGTRCTDCEKGFCMDNLCSKCTPSESGCECNVQCQNCGKKVKRTCTCKCPDGFFGSNCGSHCEDSHPNCGANPGWPTFWCNDERFPFVDENCPKMCGACKPGPRRATC